MANCAERTSSCQSNNNIHTEKQVSHRNKLSKLVYTNKFFLILRSPEEKSVAIQTLQESIEAQLALYTNISGSLSPVKQHMSKVLVSHDSHVTRPSPLRPPKLSKTSINDSIDSEYELTLL